MGIRLFLHILLLTLGTGAATHLVRRWAGFPSLAPRWLIRTTLVSFAVWPLWAALPFLRQGRPVAPWIERWMTHVPRTLDYWALLLTVALAAVMVGWGILRIVGDRAVASDYETRCRREETRIYAAGQGQLIDLIREQVGPRFEHETGKRVRFRFGSSFALPFTRPDGTIYIPLFTLTEAKGKYVVPLLEHEKNHLAEGHERLISWVFAIRSIGPWFSGLAQATRRAMEVESDRKTYLDADPEGRSLYEEALSKIVSHGMGDVGFPAIGHNPEAVPNRIDQMRTRPKSGLNLAMAGAALAALLLPGCGSFLLGGVGLREAYDFLFLHPPSSFRLTVGDPKASIHPILGVGGCIPDGIRVDTRSCEQTSRSSVDVWFGPWVGEHLASQPFLHADAEISFRYHFQNHNAVASGGAALLFGIYCNSPIISSKNGSSQLLTMLDIHTFYINLTKSNDCVNLVIPNQALRRILNPSSGLHGPIVFVPSGAFLELDSFSIKPIKPDKRLVQTEADIRDAYERFEARKWRVGPTKALDWRKITNAVP